MHVFCWNIEMRSFDLQQVPHLTTAQQGPLHQLEKHLLDYQTSIEGWLRQQWRKLNPPIYASVDLRNAGFKLSPVDTNLFPAGFNNLNPEFSSLAIQAVQGTLDRLMPGCMRILLIPESHTRNMFYLENLAVLQDILLKAGFETRIGSLLEDLKEVSEIKLPSGRSVRLEPLERIGDRIGVKGFSACFVLLNNDLSSGVPAILQNIEQPILPPLALGWDKRTKSSHFEHYAAVCQEFAELIKIDPWLINPMFRRSDAVNFLKREGEEQVIHQAEELLKAIKQKYDQYGITEKPYVVVKADAGTYGMGVLPIHDADELRQLNRKKRTDMSMAKGNRPITQVLIQEGVYTFETWHDAVAEPVVYMIGQHVIGGFYRVHTGRGVTDNLNAPGMHFEPLAFVSPCNSPEYCASPNDCTNRFYAYGVIARLALVAAAREQGELGNNL